VNQKFTSRDRLAKDTAEVIKKGERIRRDSIILYYFRGERPRLSVVISAKVTGSVGRNKMRRWVREKFRKEKDFLENYGIVVIFKPGAEKYSYREVKDRISKLWKKAGITGKKV
jgi:ribonuclease P protein component